MSAHAVHGTAHGGLAEAALWLLWLLLAPVAAYRTWRWGDVPEHVGATDEYAELLHEDNTPTAPIDLVELAAHARELGFDDTEILPMVGALMKEAAS